MRYSAAAASALLGAALSSAQDGAGSNSSSGVTAYFPNIAFPVSNPKSDHISIDQWFNFLESESSTDFDFKLDPDKARRQWDNAVEFEWGRCLAEEQIELPAGQKRKKCTYVVCNSGDGAVSYARKLELFQSIGTGDAEEMSTKFQTIYSADDAWCGYGRMDASDAEEIECENDSCLVTPLTSSMKMMPLTITRLLDAIEELYGQSDLTDLDDGNGDKRRELKEGREMRRRQLMDENTAESVNSTGYEDINEGRDNRTIQDLPKVDFYLCPGVIDEADIQFFTGMADPTNADASDLDITEYMTQWLLARTGSADPEINDTVSVGVEANYWTSSRANDLRGDDGLSSRGQFWRDVFALTLETTVCDQTYTGNLVWSADLRLEPDFSILTVAYNDTNARDIDQACIVALVASLATLTDVCVLEIQPELEVQNSYAQWLIQSGLENRRQWFDHGLDGKGEVVAVSDTGIDQNNCYFWDEEKGDATENRDDTHRKVVEYIPFVNYDDYTYGHGTHVSGTVCGKRATDGITESVGAADGVAPGAKVAFLDIGNNGGYLSVPPDSYTLSTGRSANPMAHIHSASWGSVGVNYYSSQAKNFDRFMFENDDFLINVAAGNDGRGNAFNTVSSPATFKNGLAVGCSHSTGADLSKDQLGPSYIADFSSKGPTMDGRMSPNVVAPGKYILSAGAIPSQVGECDSVIPSAGGGSWGLKSMAGTSMATPVVSGTAAQIGQYFREGWYPSGKKNSSDALEPSAALVKAVLMNGAQTDMKGVDNGNGNIYPVSAYDNVIGFGRINLIKSLYIEGWSDVQAQVWDKQVMLWNQATNNTYNVTIDKSNGCGFDYLSVTLVWVEKESTIGCAKCILNDLDLTVTDSSGKVSYPNNKGGPDRTNNAERIILGGMVDKANYTITVSGYNLDDPLQKYALIATGCFGGVANTLDTSGDAFQTDTSAQDRRNTIIITVCSVVGGILVLFCCCFGYKKYQEKKMEEEYGAAGSSSSMSAKEEPEMANTVSGTVKEQPETANVEEAVSIDKGEEQPEKTHEEVSA